MKLSAQVEQPAQKPNEKVQDFSDLSAGAKKRRALAACKKPSTRNFASAGSESKCTERVMSNDYDNIIEALEYGM